MKKGCSQIPTVGDAGEATVSGRSANQEENQMKEKKKPPFRPVKDDTKPILRDPILRSDPIESEQAVLLLPPFPSRGFDAIWMTRSAKVGRKGNAQRTCVEAFKTQIPGYALSYPKSRGIWKLNKGPKPH